MASLLPALIAVAVFGLLYFYESSADGTRLRLRPAGLITWFVAGNWPAKVGACLVIIGVGALLRYALAEIALPPELKLGGGAAASALLGAGAALLRGNAKRRALHRALAGAAFGVAYLTAYSAYGFFNYINDVNALALLALVAIAAGGFAVTSRAMSIGILAMVGAYVAPKFALGSPGLVAVCGYYLAASMLALAMVTLRGWRPLIHLSFLFTLAGVAFLGWDATFYRPENFPRLQPIFLGLVLVHVLMPLLERSDRRTSVEAGFDWAYFIALPIAAASLTLRIAPRKEVEGAFGLGLLAIVWAAAAILLVVQRRPAVLRHGMVAVLLGLAAAFCVARDLPWATIGIGFSVAAMALAPRFRWPREREELACVAAGWFGAMHVIYSVAQPVAFPAFQNGPFGQRLVAAGLLVAGAWIGMRRAIGFAKILGWAGGGWALLAVLGELSRLNVSFVPQLVYGLILAALTLGALLDRKPFSQPPAAALLVLAMLGCGWWAMQDASGAAAMAYLALTAASLIALASPAPKRGWDEGTDFVPSLAIGVLPFAALPWATAVGDAAGSETHFFEAAIVTLGAAAAGLCARRWLPESARWNERVQPLHVHLAAIALVLVTVFHIERGFWPVAFELLALAYLLAYVVRRSREQARLGSGIGMIAVLALALSLQAMLLRAFGPGGRVMDASDIAAMHLPAVATLVWVVFGAGVAWWGSRTISRPTWVAGSILLAAAAFKLAMFDFGTLGQLGNILAFIAAGLVFLGVAWLAPIPPRSGPSQPGTAEEQPSRPMPAPHGERAPKRAHGADGFVQGVAPVAAFAGAADSPNGAGRPAGGGFEGAPSRPRYGADRADPRGINGLWLVFIVLALVVALISSMWNTHVRLQSKRQEQSQLVPPSRHAQPAPARPAVAQAERVPAVAVPLPGGRGVGVSADRGQPVALADACTEFVLSLPADYVLYAAGAYQGRAPEPPTGQGRQPGVFEVLVDAPRENVVLALGAYEPSRWSIRWTPGTNVVGVFLSGYHAQTLADLPESVPVLRASYESKSPCGHFYLTRESANEAAQTIRRIFGRPARTHMLAMDGRIHLGPQRPTAAGNGRGLMPIVRIERYVDANGTTRYRDATGSR